MKFAFRLIATLMLMANLLCHATSLDLAGYQNEHGAITVAYRGEFIDPYFATRALLAAHHAGLDIEQPARAWITWLLPRQEANGLFTRFCSHHIGSWQSCADADADDALLATWIEILYVMAPCTGLTPEWQRSANLASWQLDLLLDKKSGIYQISEKNQVGLLMDNVEIYAALRTIGKKQKCMHMRTESRRNIEASEHLRLAINVTFHPSRNSSFRVSTQPAEAANFYPEKVAQIFPLMYGMSSRRSAQLAFHDWMQAYGTEWLKQESDVYPWGLIALAAQALGDDKTSDCWSSRALKLRHSERWNVLEEASFQSIRHSGQSLPCPND
jgi:hypothetical protein